MTTMTTTARPTAYDLLLACPDEQIIRMQLVWQSTVAGEWADAAAHLRNAEREGETPWHDQCGMLAGEYEEKAGAA